MTVNESWQFKRNPAFARRTIQNLDDYAAGTRVVCGIWRLARSSHLGSGQTADCRREARNEAATMLIMDGIAASLCSSQ